MAALRHGSVAVDDATIAYTVAGDRPPVLALVHGSGGNRATWWPVVPLLADHATVVTLDVRGSGRSTGTLHDPREAAADLDAVRRDVDVDRWHVVGHSLGGWHAAHHAAAHSSTTRSLTIVSSLGGLLVPAAREFLDQFAAMAQHWSQADEAGVSASYSSAYAEHHRGEVYLHQMLRELNPPATGSGVAAEVDPSALRDVPTWLVTGEHDPFAPPSVVAAIAAEVSGARCTTLDGAGHMCFVEQPQRFARLLLDFASDYT